MELKDWITIFFGLLGSIAGVGAAVWVFRKERQERSQTTERERRQTAKQVEVQRNEDAERHARAVRRAKYENDFRALEAALDNLAEAAKKITIHGPLGAGPRASDVSTIQNDLERLTKRLPMLGYNLSPAAYAAYCIASRAPGGDKYRSIDDPVLHHTIWQVVAQYWAALETPAAVEQARKALSAEWEEPPPAQRVGEGLPGVSPGLGGRRGGP